MASISEKTVHATLDEVKWYKEGVFWVAYEQSAFFVWQIKGYKPIKKYIKTLQKEVVSIGFPDSALLSLVSQANLVLPAAKDNTNEYYFTIAKAIDNSLYESWKSRVAMEQKQQKSSKLKEEDLITKIKAFPLAYKTPIEAFLFLKEVQENV